MIYTIKNNYLKVLVNSYGAELYSIYDVESKSERLWQGDKSIWPRRAPIIFPFTAQLKDGKYLCNNNYYNMSAHGFARDFEHTLIEKNDTSVRFRLTESEETKKMYPFNFTFDSIISLESNSVLHSFEITNESDIKIPFCVGYHTGYNCPFDNNYCIDDYSIIFNRKENAKRIKVIKGKSIIDGFEDYLINSDEIKLSDNLFNPNITFQNLKSDTVSIVERGTNRRIQVNFKGFPTLVLWSKTDKVRFVCIEPWYGMFEPQYDYGEIYNKPGVIVLEPKKMFSCTEKVSFIN